MQRFFTIILCFCIKVFSYCKIITDFPETVFKNTFRGDQNYLELDYLKSKNEEDLVNTIVYLVFNLPFYKILI